MDGKKVAAAVVSYDQTKEKNIVKLVFSDASAVEEGLVGDMWMTGTLSKDRIPNEGKETIDFDLGLSNGKDKVTIDFAIDKQMVKTSLLKEAGSPDLANLTVPWNITFQVEEAAPADLPVTNMVLVDTLPEGLTFDSSMPGSCQCKKNGSGVQINGSVSYDAGSRKITYAFPSGTEARAGDTYTLTLKTSFGLEIFNGQNSVKFVNQAKASYEFIEMPYTKDNNGDSIPNHDPAVKTTEPSFSDVTINSGLVDKTGVLAKGGAREIDWTVTVNSQGLGIENAKASDTIPDGLAIVPGSIQVFDEKHADLTGSLPSAPQISGQNLTLLLGDIQAMRTIQYTTTVADEFYDQNKNTTFQNHVVFSGGPGPDPIISVSKDASVKVSNALIAKSGSYDRSKHTITWTIALNQYQSHLNDLEVTDPIPEGLTLVTKGETFQKEDITVTKGDSSKIEFNYDKAAKILHAKSDGEVTEPITFTFQTTVDDPNIWAVNDYQEKPFENTAVLKIGNEEYPVSANPEIISHMFSKSAEAYDSSNHQIEWQLVCNQNELSLHNGVVKDVIPQGQEYVAGSLRLASPSDQQVTEHYDTDSRTLNITYPSEIKKQYTVTFRTNITDEAFLTSNQEKTFKNTAAFYGDELPKPIVCEAEKQATGSVLSKRGSVKKDENGISYLEWSVVVNQKQASLTKPVIVDKLSQDPKLELDPSSVKLYHAQVKGDGSVDKGQEVKLNRENITYDLSSQIFKFYFLKNIDDAYILTFRTDFGDDAKGREVDNQVYYEGSEADQESSGTRVQMSSSIAGGSTQIPKGQVEVVKYAKEQANVLAGAVFQLYNDRITYTMNPTGENGMSRLEEIRTGSYSIKEIQAPTGYVLDSEAHKISISSGSTFSYAAYNARIKGGFELTVLDQPKQQPLAGVKVNVYNEDNELVVQLITGKDGKMKVDDLEYGTYSYKIVGVPKGYECKDSAHSFTIDKDGETVSEISSVPRESSQLQQTSDVNHKHTKTNESAHPDPATGDSSEKMVIGLLVMAATFLCMLAITRMKR